MGFKPLTRDRDLIPDREEIGTFKRGVSARELGGVLGFLGRLVRSWRVRQRGELTPEIAEEIGVDLVIEEEKK